MWSKVRNITNLLLLSVALFTVACRAGFTQGGLPRHCFIETKLHGSAKPNLNLRQVSDLPQLMESFVPDMRLASITVQSEMEETLHSIKIHLSNGEQEQELSGVGGGAVKFEEKLQSKTVELSDKIDRVTIASNPDGICNLIVYDSDKDGGAVKIKMVEQASDSCKPGHIYVDYTTLRITPTTPLVGFHGRVDELGVIQQLGLILLDTVSEDCQKPKPNDNLHIL